MVLYLYSNGAGCVERWDRDAGTGDLGIRGRGDAFLPFVHFHHVSQNPRLLIVTKLFV